MEKTYLRGMLLRPRGAEEAEIVVENGMIEEVYQGRSRGDPDGSVCEGLIIPSLLDMHTHLGDWLARGDLPPGLEETVLPGGLKHKFLQGCQSSDLVRSVKGAISEVSPGVGMIMDYREGGLEGLRNLKEALDPSSPVVFPLGRVNGSEPEDILGNSSGFGVPSLDQDGIHDLRKLALKKEKIFSVHASELYREDAEKLVSLKPDQAVHMVSGTGSDWRALAEENIPVTVCPRSNMAYDLEVPLHSMLNEGLSLTIGTDNSISSRQDMFREMEACWILLRRSRMEGENAAREVFDMASGRNLKNTPLGNYIERTIPIWGADWPRKGDPAHLTCVDVKDPDIVKRSPFSYLVRFASQEDVLHTIRTWR